jgi:type I restriction enzyme S subunit
MVGEWRKVRFGEVAEILPGKYIPASDYDAAGAYVVFGSNSIMGRVRIPLYEGPIIAFARIGSNCGATMYSAAPCWINNNAAGIRAKAGCDTRFIYYWMQSCDFSQIREGSGQPYISDRALKELVLLLPPVPEQRAIAHILGTLDDKIELNRRMSETLEAMARALFKAWFVDFEPVRAKMEGRWQRGQSLPGLPAHLYHLFPDRLTDSELGEIPEGWEVATLGKFFRAGPSGAWGQDEPSGSSAVRVRCLRGIDCHDLAEGRVPKAPVRWLTANQAHARRLDNGAILIEGSGSFCRRSLLWNPAYAELFEEPVLYSNFCKRLDPLCSASQALVGSFHIRQAYREGELQAFRTGTAFPNFDIRGLLMNLIVVMPPEPLARLFADVLNIRRRVSLMKESRTLAALRDALLPKLIRGEIRVKDAERFLKKRGL